MPANKLNQEHKEAVLVWLCEGLTDVDIVERLGCDYGVSVTRDNIRKNYRKPNSQAIKEAEQEAYEVAVQSGYGLRSQRIAALSRKARRLDQALDETAPTGWSANGLNFLKEFRETLGAIAKECGQEPPTRLEQDINLNVNGEDPKERLARRVNALRARGVAAGVGEADAGGSSEA